MKKEQKELRNKFIELYPEEAKKLGADYIVVGRSITESKNPVKTAETIYEILRK